MMGTDRPTEGKHEGHNITHCTAGAPGTGTVDYCWDCKEYFTDNTRILTIDEVR